MDKTSEELTSLHRKIVRIRDHGAPCIYCNQGYMTDSDEVCHYIDVSKAPGMRWLLFNAAMGHRCCNQESKHNLLLQNNIQVNMMNKFGVNTIMGLNREKNKPVKYSRSEKIELVDFFKEILSNIKKLN
jgi:hypothetical protein